MRSVRSLTGDEARRIDILAFDLDDTVLDHGALTEEAYSAMFRLRASGVELVACTGRPAGWAEIVARQWPIRAAIAENGAVAWTRAGSDRLVLLDTVDAAVRSDRRRRLDEIAQELLAQFDVLTLAEDNVARRTDVTFDIGEHRRVDPATVGVASQRARDLGARTFVSSVHMHVTFEGYDKASGFVRWAGSAKIDPTRALVRSAFVGDSGNDAAAFAAFGLTFAVSNVAPFLRKLTVEPRYVAEHPMGRGFAEIAAAIVSARSGA